ncbi:MAG: hypothetical protein IJR68_05605 [Fretibacterium sp.]|nr:hypothetical protein [Fretibacterium sp.]
MTYQWKIELPIPAQEAGEYLEKLEERDGCITAQSLLEESRPENAPLHRCFEWDDAKAAELYRLKQARFIISNLTVEISETEIKPRGFVSVSETRETGRFVSISRAMSTPEMKGQVLRNALDELLNFRKKYSGLQELAELFRLIDKLVA